MECCELVQGLAERGWTHGSGVPCSAFSGPIAHLTQDGRYEASANEGVALSTAVGAALGGRRQAVFLQNSGLGNLINPLTSLCMPYGVPVLVLMSLRGWPDPTADEPQHAVMGRSSRAVLDALGVWHRTLDGSPDQLARVLDEASTVIARRAPAFVLVPMGTIGPHGRAPRLEPFPHLPDSTEVARAVTGWADEHTVVFATTGYLSRALFAAGDRERNFYMQGSMGHVSALAHGWAQAQPGSEVLVLDGDGAALMHLGQLVVLGPSRCDRLIHVIVDNGAYASTGGQVASSGGVDFAAAARAFGYRSAVTVSDVGAMVTALDSARRTGGPHCVVVDSRATIEGGPPPRPSSALSLDAIADRLSRSAVPAVFA